MGQIKDKSDDVYRDFKTAGVPASGPNEPAKSGIRALFGAVDVAVGAAQAGLTTVSTIAARDTFYAIEANRGALVYVNNNNGSATDPANGVYEYVGTARLAQSFYAGLAAVVQPIVEEAEDARDEAASIVASLKKASSATIGNTAVVTGPPISDLTIIAQKAAVGDGTLTKMRIFMLSAGTVRITTFSVRSDNGTIFAKPTRAVVVLNLPAGASFVDLGMPISQGEYPGFYAAARPSSASGSSNPIYYISGDGTALTNEFPVQPFSGSNTQFGFECTFLVLALSRFEVVADEATAQSLSAANPDVVYLVAS